MKILVDKLPERSRDCLFKKGYNEIFKYWNCAFNDTTVCSLDCGKMCDKLKELDQQ